MSSQSSSNKSKNRGGQASISGISITQFKSSIETKLISTKQDRTNAPLVQFSDGAIEALRLCHSEFISFLSSSLAIQNVYVNEQTVRQTVNDLGFEDLLDSVEKNISDVKKINTSEHNSTESQLKNDAKRIYRKPKKISKKKISVEMAMQQEKLLAESAAKVNQGKRIQVNHSLNQIDHAAKQSIQISWNGETDERHETNFDLDDYLK